MRVRAAAASPVVALALIASSCGGSSQPAEPVGAPVSTPPATAVATAPAVEPTPAATTATATAAATATTDTAPAVEPTPTATAAATATTATAPAVEPTTVPASDLPSVEIIDVATGATVNLAGFAPSDRPLVLWFWAPH